MDPFTVMPTHDLAEANRRNADLPHYTKSAIIGPNIVVTHTIAGKRKVHEWTVEALVVHFDSMLALVRSRFPNQFAPRSPMWVIWENAHDRRHLSVKYWRSDTYNFGLIWQFISKLLNYDDCYTICEITIKFLDCQGNEGSGRIRKTVTNGTMSVGYYGPDDHMCGARALILLWKYKEYQAVKPAERTPEMKSEWRLLRRMDRGGITSKRHKLLQTLALRLLNDAKDVPMHEPLSLQYMGSLAETLKSEHYMRLDDSQQVHINVYDENMALIFTTHEGLFPDPSEAKGLPPIIWYDLCLSVQHYTPITKIHRLLHHQRHYCYSCKKSYSNTHVCPKDMDNKCKMCGMKNVDHFEEYKQLPKELRRNSHWKDCDTCGCRFYGQICYDYHHATPTSKCSLKWKCNTCNKKFFRRTRPDGKVQKITKARLDPEDHKCGDTWCTNCKSFGDLRRHECYMECIATVPEVQEAKYLFCDFESDQSTGEHVINLIVTQDSNTSAAPWPVFTDIQEWLTHLLSEEYSGYTVIFHNGKGYDFQFILAAVVERKFFNHKLNPILVGGKILYFTIARRVQFTKKSGLRFVDSLNFLTMSLRAFTKTFGLTTKKGYYPHFFNTKQNAHYVGDVPGALFFGVEKMTPSDYKTFKQWHSERQQQGPWDNAKELLEYCEADVTLLREGCMKFRELVMESTTSNHDPFTCITLASSALRLFRTDVLQPDTVAALSVETSRALKPCLAGGRTGTCKMYQRINPNTHRMYYVDFCSAYPWVNKYGTYPIGHPVIHRHLTKLDPINDWPDMHDGVSIWLVDIECPNDLYHPLLHSKDPVSGLLMFDLRPKKHAMYTSLELLKALELGYRITFIYEVYHWPTVVVGLFKDYINVFLRIKQESSGWPEDCITEDDKRQYIYEYERVEGIRLNYDEIKKNPGRRKTAKLYLNSLWGKMGQRLNDEFETTHILHDDPHGIREFNRIRAKPGGFQDIVVVNHHTVIAKEKNRELPKEERIGCGNIALAIFTTAQARLKLYNELLEPLGERICYYDTDSAIFACHKDEMDEIMRRVPLGQNLGDVTSEIGDPYNYDSKNFIVEFISGGPKNYGYRTVDDMKKIKIKGHTVHSMEAQKILNYETMKNCILQGTQFKVTSNQIVRAPGYVVKNRYTSKVYRLSFMKRFILPLEELSEEDMVKIDTRPWNETDGGEAHFDQVNQVKSAVDPGSVLVADSLPEVKVCKKRKREDACGTHRDDGKVGEYCVIMMCSSLDWLIAGTTYEDYGDYTALHIQRGFHRKILVENLTQHECEHLVTTLAEFKVTNSARYLDSLNVKETTYAACRLFFQRIKPLRLKARIFIFDMNLFDMASAILDTGIFKREERFKNKISYQC